MQFFARAVLTLFPSRIIDMGLVDIPQNGTLVHYIDVIMLIEQYKQDVAPVLKALVRHMTKDGER